MQLTENFHLEEFLRSHTADKRSIDNTPPSGVIKNLGWLAEWLEELRIGIGNVPIIIVSGYRNHELNEAVGGQRDSRHTMGLAADFYAIGKTPQQVIDKAIEIGLAFDELIGKKTTVHVGLSRPEMLRWIGTDKRVVSEVFPSHHVSKLDS
ncbi:MAG: peptidase M15 [Acidobacteria bacterium]|nr:peptidase M15 [Acidobacteriota bacterium]